MKVRCIALRSDRGDPEERSSWLRLGATYSVLMIWIEPTRQMLRLVGEEPTPALFQADLFEVVSSIIPPNWIVVSPKPGFLEMAPEAWTRPGFWVRYFDGDAEAIASFKGERKKILESDP